MVNPRHQESRCFCCGYKNKRKLGIKLTVVVFDFVNKINIVIIYHF